jgi:MFS transporter, DHA1 family, tetracycline resistance protein
MKRPSLLIIFLTVFIDLIGFGIVMPLLPRYSHEFGAHGFMIGLIFASFSIMQFLFAPMWGGLSDRIGRRPVLLISTAGSTIAYAIFAMASTMKGNQGLMLLLASRIFAGICGANLSVASAYIADVSPPEKRSKSMGLIGMAFGLGFIFGPALGSFGAAKFGDAGPGWIAAAVCGINFILACFVLAESRKPGAQAAPRRPRFGQWAHTLAQPTVGFLILMNFVAVFCFSTFEVTFGLLVEPLGYDLEHIGYLITFCGVITALIQGVIGRLVKKVGERKLVAASLIILGASLAVLPFVTSLTAILFGLALLAIGSGVNRPPTMGLISILTPPSEQGATLGVTQSAASLARIVAPILAGTMFEYRASSPYMMASAIAVAAGVVSWMMLCRHKVEAGA